MKPTSKTIYRTTAEIRARLLELEERERHVRRDSDLLLHRQRPDRVTMRSCAEPSERKTLH
jgi:hypothetical protein